MANIELICPMCGKGRGKIFYEKYIGWGAECNNCNFKINPHYKYPDGAIWRWNESRKFIESEKNKIIKEKEAHVYWSDVFQGVEGQYIIRTPEPENFLLLKYIDKFNDEWCTPTLKKISDYPKGTLFYGPIPHFDDPDWNLGLLNKAIKKKKK